MVFKVCFGITIALLAAMLAFGTFLVFVKKRIKYPIAVFVILQFFAGASIFFPLYWSAFEEPFKSTIVSFHSSLILFTLNSGFETMLDAGELLDPLGQSFKGAYYTVAAITYFIAPILTATFILSLLKSFLNFLKFKLSFAREVYVFSELNKKTANLAKSIKEKKKGAVIVFCDINPATIDENDELFEILLDIKAICLKDDIGNLKFHHHVKSKKKGVYFFLISEDDEKIVNQYNAIVHENADMENGTVYLFSRSAQSDLVFNSVAKKKITCRKYDSDFLIIYNYLFEKGIDLFKTAQPINNGLKQICVTIVGFGLNGKMLTKALAWFCQMDGYRLEINVFDSDPDAVSKFKEQAPDLLNKAFAKPTKAEENQYVINIHAGVAFGTLEFTKKMEALAKKTTFAFTCLGDDERNLAAAIKLREIFERNGRLGEPPIVSVVYSGEKDYVTKASNHKTQEYKIQCIGSYEHTYSHDFIINSALEDAAIKVHTRYGSSTEGLFGFAYNYRSSCASAIHMKTKIALQIHNAQLPRNKLTEEEIMAIAAMEHRRWSAWTRGEGYVYGPDRNDLAKIHHDLIEFSKLPKSTQEYDIKVGTLDPEPEE